jgi:mono/diheme cytochrome c family protein/glucose/arabinose dehydrogenase
MLPMRPNHRPFWGIAFALLPLLPLGAEEKDDPVVPVSMIPAAPVLKPDDALKAFKVAPGFVIEPVATEPLVEKPVALDFDGRGRMWVCEMDGYMPNIDGKGEDVPKGRIAILEDTNGDGKIDKRTVFLDKLLMPRAVTIVDDGILFSDQNTLYHVKRDGDKPAGEPEIVDAEYAKGGNVEHKANGLLHGLDNWLYNAKSDRRYRKIDGKWVMEKTAFRGQWGISMDDYGRLFFTGNSTILHGNYIAPQLAQGNPGINMDIRETREISPNTVWPARVTPGVNRAYQMKVNGFEKDTLDPKTFKLINATGVAGTVIYRGTNFPKEWYGRAFSCESCVQLVKAVDMKEVDGKFVGTHPTGETEFLASTDERFRPVNSYNAPDGSLYIVDLYHGIIQHRDFLSKYLRQQSLDRGLDSPGEGQGRIYRVRYQSGALQKTVNLETLPSNELVKMLVAPNGWNRDMAQRLLVDRGDVKVVPLLEKLAAMNQYPLGQIKALWTLEGLNQLTAEPILAMLKSDDPKVVSSALWASTKVVAPAEVAELLPAISGLKPKTDEVKIYLARALGRFGPGKAFDALVDLLKTDLEKPLVKQLAVAGLDKHEAEFQEAIKGKIKDSNLEKWLTIGAADVKEKPPAESVLTGDHLASFKRGKNLFTGNAVCASCHGADGMGMPSLGPPLNESEWVTGKPDILLAIILNGMSGPITVNKVNYTPTADMPGFALNTMISDKDLADVATYIRHEWDNTAEMVKPDQVAKMRAATASRAGKAYTAKDFQGK